MKWQHLHPSLALHCFIPENEDEELLKETFGKKGLLEEIRKENEPELLETISPQHLEKCLNGLLGMLENNVYLISDGESTMVVDPSCKADVILEALGGRKVDAIVLTHRHFDHEKRLQ